MEVIRESSTNASSAPSPSSDSLDVHQSSILATLPVSSICNGSAVRRALIVAIVWGWETL